MDRETILKKTGSYDEYLIESLRDPEEAAAYLQVALEEYQEDGDLEFFLTALRDITEAHGGIGELAKKTKLNRQNLYNILSHKGNPRLSTLGAILKYLGYCLSVKPIQKNVD